MKMKKSRNAKQQKKQKKIAVEKKESNTKENYENKKE